MPIEIKSGQTLNREFFVGLQVELEELLGVPVDLLTPGDLPPRFRDRVLAEARPV